MNSLVDFVIEFTCSFTVATFVILVLASFILSGS